LWRSNPTLNGSRLRKRQSAAPLSHSPFHRCYYYIGELSSGRVLRFQAWPQERASIWPRKSNFALIDALPGLLTRCVSTFTRHDDMKTKRDPSVADVLSSEMSWVATSALRWSISSNVEITKAPPPRKVGASSLGQPWLLAGTQPVFTNELLSLMFYVCTTNISFDKAQ
jgi:hypothetical protein